MSSETFWQDLPVLSILAVGDVPSTGLPGPLQGGDLRAHPYTWPRALGIGWFTSIKDPMAWEGTMSCPLPTGDHSLHCPLRHGDIVPGSLVEASWLFPGEAQASVIMAFVPLF